MIVLVTGGRWWAQRDETFAWMDAIHAEEPITMLIHGDATGADTICAKWAESRGIPTKAFPIAKSDWTRYGRMAGHRRNQTMLDQNPDILVAFPGGAGTNDMKTRAQRKGLPILEYAA